MADTDLPNMGGLPGTPTPRVRQAAAIRAVTPNRSTTTARR
jgi:hypothetical protein